MPKSSRGGKAGATTTFTMRQPVYHPVTNPRPTPQPVPQPAPNPIQQNTGNPNLDSFRKMTDDQKADVLSQVKNTQVPIFLAQSDTQRVLYGLGMNDKPTLVDDSTLDTMPGKDLYRVVNSTNDPTNRIKYAATDVANQVIRGTVTRVSDTGGSVHGRGVYFADSYGEAAVYGHRAGNIQQTAVIRVKLSQTAKTVSERIADNGVMQEINSGSKLGKTIAQMGSKDRTAIWALARGYDAIVASNGYHVIINRSALVASKTINPMGYKWK